VGSGKAIARNKMTHSEAKEILRLYRPGTADSADSTFAEALALCERDTELNQWFGEHCALYSAMRAKFKQIAVPEGLKEQIIAERKIHTGAVPMWQRAVIVAGAFAVIALVFWRVSTNWQPSERHDFKAYSGNMVSFAARSYGRMDVDTNDLDVIRQTLAQSGSIADYVLPGNLQKNATAAGCLATTWQGKKVSMICFRTGRPLKPGLPSDLWLFITDRSSASSSPTSTKPVFEQEPEPGVISASWTVGNRTYLLATQGDQKLLEQFL
jgi:hypothetical protein